MNKSIATVTTTQGSLYLQQLCKHWAHKFEVTFDPQQGRIAFSGGRVVELAANDTALTVTITDDVTNEAEKLEQVVQDHILRFAFREQLAFNWSQAA